MRSRKTKGTGRAGLTPSQIILLSHAKAGPIQMLQADRMGTRCTAYDEDTGAALMVAYASPERVLVRRGLLRPRNEPHSYDLTDAGREAIAKAEGRR